MRRIDLIDLDGEAQGPPNRCADEKAGSAAGCHRQILGINTTRSGLDPFRGGQPRPPPGPLIDSFQNRPHSIDSGIDDPSVVEVEGGGFSGAWGHMFVVHGTTVV